MKENLNDLNYTCLFGGGAIRGTAHAGALKALDELKVNITTYAGSSVGSIVAALSAIGYSYQEITDIFLKVNFELFRDISIGFNKKFALSKGDVFLSWLKELIEKKYYGDKYIQGENQPVTFNDLGKNLIIITTDMKNFSCCEFSNFETPDFEIAMAVRISCCMPGLMRAVNIDDKLLVDGDLMKGKPMWSLSKNLINSKDRILEIRLEGEFTGTDENPIDYVNGMYSCITCSETDFVKSLYQNCDNYDYIVINTGNVVVVDFNASEEKRQEIAEKGYETTINYFKNDLLLKKNNLLEKYTTIYNSLLKTKHNFAMKKYVLAKNNIAELFIYLCDINKDIDKFIYKGICDFQKQLYECIKIGLFGYCTCQNRQLVYENLQGLINELSDKIKNLKQYIKNIKD